MRSQIGLDAAAGAIVAAAAWRGNQAPHLVSVFPDWITFLLLVGLLALALGVERWRRPDRTARLRTALTIAAAAGTVFGLAVALLGGLRFSNPAPALLSFGFLTALATSLVCGALMAAAWPARPRHKSR